MKKSLALLPLLAALLIFTFGCKKIDQNPEFKFTIIAKTVDDSTRVQNAFVEVGVPATVNNKLQFYGYTNENGEVQFEYDSDAVFRLRVTRGSNPYSYIGCSYVRLEPNENVVQTVYLEPYDPTFPGCDLSF